MELPRPESDGSAEVAEPRRRGARTAVAMGPYRRLRTEVDAALNARCLSRKGGAAMMLKVVLVLLHWGFWYAVALYLGTLHRVRARSAHGRLESGQQIIVLGYDPEKNLYEVDDASTFVDRA